MLFRCYNIEWDIDEEDIDDVSLPSEVEIEIDHEEEICCEGEFSDCLSDKLSDEYGFCHFGFEFEVIVR